MARGKNYRTSLGKWFFPAGSGEQEYYIHKFFKKLFRCLYVPVASLQL